jgi:16S rRNA (cytidine1402-2'-O)-methyltransferase
VRVVASLGDMAEVLGDREAFLCREATKLHEEYIRAPLSELRTALTRRSSIKGEFVIVVSGASALPSVSEPAEVLFARLVGEGKTRREAVKETARILGLPAREVYRRVL